MSKGQKRDIALIKDFEGKQYNDLIIEHYNKELSNSRKRIMFDCKCKLCGNTFHTALQDILSGSRKNCGCVNKKEKYKMNQDLTNQKFGHLTVLNFNRERSAELKRTCWDCKCDLCGSTRPIQERELLAGKEDCGCQKRIKASQTKKTKQIEYVNNNLVNTTNKVGSKILGVNQKLTNENIEVYVDIECASCGKVYSALLSYVKKGRNPYCPDCVNHGVNHPHFKDYTGMTIGNYYINGLNRFDDPPLWNCTDINTGSIMVLNSDQLYKITYKETPKIVPFTFVNK